MDLVLFLGVPAVLAVGYLVWSLWFSRRPAPQPEGPNRRREDARDWQRRFGTDSLLAVNFLQPTQNEILEILCVLDQLTPSWESAQPELAERHFLNELSLSFPSLCKPISEFPLPFAERLAARPVGMKRSARPLTEEEVASKREEARVARAHANALEQMVSGPARPSIVTAGSLPFRVSVPAIAPLKKEGPWPARLAGAMVLGAAMFGIVHFLPKGANSMTVVHAAEPALVQVPPTATPEEIALSSPPPAEVATGAPPLPTPTLPTVASAEDTNATRVPTPATAPVAAAPPAPPAVAPTPPPSTPDPAKAALVQQIAGSKQRALAKHPELAVESSEINLRFVFRYKALIQQNSPRLLDPNWPEQLAEECAAAAGSSLRRPAVTQVSRPPR